MRRRPAIALRLGFPDGELDRWACLGALSDRSVRVWVREPGSASVPVSLRTAQGAVAHASAQPDPGHDGIACLDLALDQPAPRERFAVQVGAQRLEGRFAPTAGQATAFAFGFGSCHQPFAPAAGGRVEKHAGAGIYDPMRRILSGRAAEFLLLVGDQVYSDGVRGASVREWSRSRPASEPTTGDDFLDAYRHLYRGYFNESGFRALLEAFPSYMTWDDHDIMDSWGSRFVTGDHERRMFAAAGQAYREYQWTHDPTGSFDGRPPYAYDFWYGDVGFFVLDLRGVRSWQDEVAIGDLQQAELDRFLRTASERDVQTVFIVASIPVIHFSPRLVRVLQWVPGGKGSDVRDRWDAAAFAAERDRLIDALGSWQRSGARRQVIILSGDVHAGAAFHVRDRVTGGVFEQWTSSSLSAPGGLGHTIANRLGSRFVNWGEARCDARRAGIEPRNNFGAVRVEPLPEGGHSVEFSLYGLGDHGVRRRFSATARPAARRPGDGTAGS